MKSKIRLISIMLFLLLLLGANSKALIKEDAIIKESIAIKNENFVAETIPLSFDRQYGVLPVVEMKIGKKIVRLIVDTGADWVTLGLKPTVLESLEDTHYINGKKSMDTYGKTYQEKCFMIPSVGLGNLELCNLIANEELRSFVPEDGIIGNGFLKQFYVLFDYPASKVIFYPKYSYPKELNLASWMKVPFIHNRIGMLIEGRLGAKGKKLKFCFDTGYGATEQGKSVGEIRSQYVGRTLKEISYIQTEHFYLEGNDLGPMGFMINDFKQPPVAGFIGHNILVDFQVLIDFDRQFLFLKRPNK